jgi:hypothetical protein
MVPAITPFKVPRLITIHKTTTQSVIIYPNVRHSPPVSVGMIHTVPRILKKEDGSSAPSWQVHEA